ncbi:hypothetical protein K1719_035576 [Acacia pycnantha]|nr:hypothetical protein K1719_035576 [Acacia pycnantha]
MEENNGRQFITRRDRGPRKPVNIVKENGPWMEAVIVPKGSQQRAKRNGQVMLHDTGVSDCNKKQGLDSVEDVGQYYGDDMKDNGGDKISLVSADANQVQIEGGAASKGFDASLKNLIFVHKVDMVVLLETRISGDKAKKAIRSFGFRYSEIVEALGFVRGIWLMWNNSNLVVKVMERHLQFLHYQLMIGGQIPWYFTAVYASPHENVTGSYGRNWMIEGSRLIDLGAQGPFFTWSGHERVFKRLDRCLCNMEWQELFPESMVKADIRGCNLLAECIVKQHDSRLWKNVARLWPEVIKGIGWEVRDGRSVKFWEDRWLNGVDKLGNYFVGELGMLNSTLTVSQTLNREGNWNWAWLEGVLLHEVTQLLKSIPPPCLEDGDDIVVWRGIGEQVFGISNVPAVERRCEYRAGGHLEGDLEGENHKKDPDIFVVSST